MKKASELSDREIQEARLENSRIANNHLKTIKLWVAFMGVVTLISVLGALLFFAKEM